MRYLGRTPAAPLDAYIERIWYCSDAPGHARERVFPSGTVDLVVNLAEDQIRVYDAEQPESLHTHAGAVVRGPYTRTFLADPRQRASVLGVHFRPGGALALLGVSPSEFADAFVPLDEIWGSTGRSVRERLLEAGSPEAQLQLLEALLLRKLQSVRAGHPAARAAVAAFRSGGAAVRVTEVASDVGLSHRGFIDVFRREIGLSPKLYLRLERFHRAKQHIATFGAPSSWAAFALDCGYFDQSHMIRDFVAFSGISPTRYLRTRADETRFDHLIHGFTAEALEAGARGEGAGARGGAHRR